MKLKGSSYLLRMYRRTTHVYALDPVSKQMIKQSVNFKFEITNTHYFITEYNHATQSISKGTISILKWNDYVTINMSPPYNLSLASAVKYAERYFIKWESEK